MSDPGGIRPSRAERSGEVQRRWRTQGIIAGVVVAAILLVIIVTPLARVTTRPVERVRRRENP